MIKPNHTLDDYEPLSLTSSAFSANGPIPRKYTCDGSDINPSLEIASIPTKAKSLALVVVDPDAPGGTWVHWIVCNIPITHKIEEHSVPGIEGVNDFGRVDYGGPCPPDGKHRYFFKMYALDQILELEEGFTLDELNEAMHSHILGYGELMGVYTRN